MSMFSHKRKDRQKLYEQTRGAVSKAGQRLLHDLGLRGEDHGRKVTAQTASKEAIELVYGILSSYVWLTPPKLAYGGIHRADQRFAQRELDHGVVTVTANVRTPIGVTLGIDVPVEIRNGHLLEPAVMFHSDTPYVISQSSIDRIMRDNSAWGQMPTRKMYQGPLDQSDNTVEAPMRTERRTPSMFSTRAAAAALRTIVRSRGARGSLRVAQAEDATIFTQGQTLWQGKEPWIVVKVQKSPVGGQTMYQVRGPRGEMKFMREDKAIEIFGLEPEKGPYAQQNKGPPKPTHLKNLVREEPENGIKCTEEKCEAINKPTARRCYNCGKELPRGSIVVPNDENPRRKQYLQENYQKLKESPWMYDHMSSDIQKMLTSDDIREFIQKHPGQESMVPPSLLKRLEKSDIQHPEGPLELPVEDKPEPLSHLPPGMIRRDQNGNVIDVDKELYELGPQSRTRFTPTEDERKQRAKDRQGPLDDGVVTVPETTLLSDEDTAPTKRQVFRPKSPLFDKPKMHTQVKHKWQDPGADKPTTPDLRWHKEEDGTLTASGVDGIYEVRAGVQKGHQMGYALYFKGKEIGVFGDPSLATTMASKHHRKQLATQDAPSDQLNWSQTKEGVLIAPGAGRGIYMVRPGVVKDQAKGFGLYYKDRSGGPIQEIGIFKEVSLAIKTAQRHFAEAMKAEMGPGTEQGADEKKKLDEDNAEAEWRRKITERQNAHLPKKSQVSQLHWDEVEPDAEWMASSVGGGRYTIMNENGKFNVYLNHRRWSTPGPVVSNAPTLDAAMDAAEQDFHSQLDELKTVQADRGSLRAG
jgi:hypothetical protein